MTIRFDVQGTPKGQPRARAFARTIGTKVTARMYDPGTAEGWKGQIALAANAYRPDVPIEGPVSVEIDFLFARPQRLLTKKTSDARLPHIAKPDRDNCEKAVLDCLTQLGFWRDDAQVCSGEVRKYYCARNESPGAIITISNFTIAVTKQMTDLLL